jgi:hypothetical protein
MKKFLLLGCMMLLVSAANASYLYWQIESDDDATATLQTNNGGSGDSAVTVYAVVDDGYGNAILAPTETLVPGVVYAIDSTTVNSGYSYWVEMSNSSATATKYTGSDFASMTYSDAAETTSLADIADGTVPVATWHASSGSMSPAPEPTSAILMLFGVAMLGLKRKQRRLA